MVDTNIYEQILKEDNRLHAYGSVHITNETFFTLRDVKKLFELSVKQNGSDMFRRLPLPMRSAMIVVFEEYIQRSKLDKSLRTRDDYTFDFIYNRALSRFDLKNRNKKRFNHSLSEIHPEDPCTFYEDNGRKKGKYKSALERIIIHSSWLIQEGQAELSILEIYDDVKDC